MQLHEIYQKNMHLHAKKIGDDVKTGKNSCDSKEAVKAWGRLIRVSTAALEAIEADLKAAGHPPLVWYDALLELRRAGGCGLRQYELGKQMLLAQYNLSRLSDRLEKAGYAARKTCPDDCRGHNLVITDAGLDLLARMAPDYLEAIEKHFTLYLEPSDLPQLIRILDRFPKHCPA